MTTILEIGTESGLKATSLHVEEIESIERFEEVLRSNVIVFADLYADWCGPCRMLKPYVHKIADDYAGRIKVIGINVEKNGVLAQRLGVYSIPDVRIFQDGRPIQKIVGAHPGNFYTGLIDHLLARK
jgi:thioredoxin 1